MATNELQMLKQKEFAFEDFEVTLKTRVSKEFKTHQPEWKHTLEVVKNIKRLVTMEGGKRDILVCAAYFHELGHIAVENGTSEFVGKPIYVQRGLVAGQKARTILSELSFDPKKTHEVANLLESNNSLELKRAHHVFD